MYPTAPWNSCLWYVGVLSMFSFTVLMHTKYVELTWICFILDNPNCSVDKTVQVFYQKKKKQQTKEAQTLWCPVLKDASCAWSLWQIPEPLGVLQIEWSRGGKILLCNIGGNISVSSYKDQNILFFETSLGQLWQGCWGYTGINL